MRFHQRQGRQAHLTALCKQMQTVYERRMNTLAGKVYPFIKMIFEKQGNMYKNIAIPISDGRKMLTLSVDLEKAYNTQGKEMHQGSQPFHHPLSD